MAGRSACGGASQVVGVQQLRVWRGGIRGNILIPRVRGRRQWNSLAGCWDEAWKPGTSIEAKSTVTVPCRFGLHLRVAALVVTMARKFQSDIRFCSSRRCVDAKSILGMLELTAVRGKRLSLVAHGPDAQRAVQVLAELFESKEILCKEGHVAEEVSDGHA